MFRLFCLSAYLMMFSTLFSNAQTDKLLSDKPAADPKIAKNSIASGNYKSALNDYLQLFKDDSTNLSYCFQIGICYLYTNIDKTKAVYFLEKAVSDTKVENKAWYELGRAYLINYEFDKAIAALKKYKDLTSGNEDFYISADRIIEMCEEAKNKIEHPVNVTIENLGSEVNSAFPDFNPYIPYDESYIIFSSKRVGNTGNYEDFDGYNTSDVYISYQKYDVWLKAKGIGSSINSELVEETAGMSPEGSKLFLYYDNYEAMNQLMISERKGKNFQKPTFILNNVKYSKIITSATISLDKKFLVFASDKNEKAGGMDLFISRKLPSGQWGSEENIGSVINTIYDEDFPYFAPDGKTLYFCSQGHNSMGGYDIFKTIFDEKTNLWSEPVNLGYPVNTPDDDMTISLSASGRHGYISSFRKNGYGDLDIYRVIFNNIAPSYTIISGNLLNKDSVCIFKSVIKRDTVLKNDSNKTIVNIEVKNDSVSTQAISKETNKNINISIVVKDLFSQSIFGKYQPNKAKGKFLVILPPGEYELIVDAEGYEKYSEKIKIFDRYMNSDISKDIILYPSLTEKKEMNN